MGWLDRIFGKGEIVVEERKETGIPENMSLKDVGDFLEKKSRDSIDPLKESTKKEIKKEYADLQTVADTMHGQLNILEQAPYSPKENPMLIRKSVGSRKSFVNKMRFLVRQMQSPIGKDMDSMLKFHNDAAKLINVTNARTVQEYTFMKELFGKDGTKVLQSFRQIAEIDKKIGSAIKGFRDSTADLLEAKRFYSEILELTQRIEETKKSRMDEKTEEIRTEMKRAEDELEKLPDSKSWETFLDMEKVRDDLEARLRDKRSDFTSAVSKVEAPLKKYKWSIRNSVLDDYVGHSIESVIHLDPKGEVFMSAIKEIKTKLDEGDMNLDRSGTMLSTMEKMIEDNTIGRILDEYRILSKKLREQKEKIISDGIVRKKEGLENTVKRLKRDINATKAEKGRIKESVGVLEEDKRQKLKRLEHLITIISGKSVTLGVG